MAITSESMCDESARVSHEIRTRERNARTRSRNVSRNFNLRGVRNRLLPG
jgi:hypothetical protein